MSGLFEHRRAATKAVKSLGLEPESRTRAVVLVAADSTMGNSLRELIQLNEDDPGLKALVQEFLRGAVTGTVMVDAETDEVRIRSFKVPRNQQSKLNVASIEKYLVNRGLVLLAIDTDNGYPPCKDAWTLYSYVTTPI